MLKFSQGNEETILYQLLPVHGIIYIMTQLCTYFLVIECYWRTIFNLQKCRWLETSVCRLLHPSAQPFNLRHSSICCRPLLTQSPWYWADGHSRSGQVSIIPKDPRFETPEGGRCCWMLKMLCIDGLTLSMTKFLEIIWYDVFSKVIEE